MGFSPHSAQKVYFGACRHPISGFVGLKVGDKQMKSLNKYLFTLLLLAMLPALSFGQQQTAVQTAKLGVETLLDTVAASRSLFLSDRNSYFAAI